MSMSDHIVLEPIRPCVRAVVLRAGYVLVQVKEKPGKGTYLTLPGGKQEAGETLTQALKRECFEEVGADVVPRQLLAVADVFKPKETGSRHQMEILFLCAVDDTYQPVVGPHPDPSQIATRWADPVTEADLFRPAYAPHLRADLNAEYLGTFDG